MKASTVLAFQQTATAQLRRPWQTFKNGQLWYGMLKTGTKRLPLTTKQGNKNYYKGTRSSGIGRLNAAGTYIVNWDKVRTYVVPTELNSSELKPLVSPRVPQIKQKFIGYEDGAKSPQFALDNIINFVEHGENYKDVDLLKTDFLEEFVSTKTSDDLLAETAEVESTEKQS